MNDISRFFCGTVLFFMSLVPALGEGPTRTEIAKLGKAATALVEAGNNTQGSAFCIHPAGFFITNAHVVRQGGGPTLILNPGQKNEKALQARVVRADEELDLALLQVSGQNNFPALALGTVEGLTELTEVVAFGYPFGNSLAAVKTEKPAISINVGSITSLREKAGELHRIQLDAALNPGNSGGPVLDKEGKVIGVVVSGIKNGPGVNFAIPVSYLSKFVARPEIVFDPPTLRLAQIHEPVEFQAKAVSLLPSNKKGFDLVFHLFVEDKKSRKFKMELKDGMHRVRTEPIPKQDGPLVLGVSVVFDKGTVNGKVNDRTVQVGGADIKLSEIANMSATKKRVMLHEGKSLRGELKNLEAVPISLGSESVTLDLTKAKLVRLERPGGFTGLGCTVVAFQDGKEVGRLTRDLTIKGLPAIQEDFVDLEIEPPVLSKEKEVRELPSTIQDVAGAGGGRYLILHLPKISKLAVFDVNEAKVVQMLPAPEDDLKFAGGLDKLVVVLPGAKKIQRWNLNSFELEKTVPFDARGELMSMSMGSSSQGPIVVSFKEQGQQGPFPLPKFFQLSLDKLERLEVQMQGHLHNLPAFAHLRCSADGKSMGLWYTNTGFTGAGWIKWQGPIGQVSYEHTPRGYVIPGPNSKVVFTGMGMYTGLSLVPNQQSAYPGTDRQAQYLPALHGDYYLYLGLAPQPPMFFPKGVNPKGSNGPASNPGPGPAIYKRGLNSPLLKRPDIDIPPQDAMQNLNHDFTFDKRVLLIPQAKLLITIPTSNDRLVLHRVDLEEALEKAGGAAALQGPDVFKPAGTELVLNNGLAKVEGSLAQTDPMDTVMVRSHRKIYSVKLQAGKTYQIDHQSKAFDAFLRLEDAQGTQQAADDDSGGNLNARIVFQCITDGTYRIIATSLNGGFGEFSVTIQQR